ncbi:MAG: glycoside hydrolase family 13 protein [Anaerolineales bacterium]|nr:glycoside hydrolase family 13 protein [Anaerolineales bacterium]
MTTPEWVKDAVFYQIFPDRFAKSKRVPKKGLNLETWDSPPTVYGFKGGDLLGVTEHLDYLHELGITAIYFNPVFASAANHRYHTYDYYNVDPLLGGNDALRELLDSAHARGIRVVLDGVFNHASRGLWQFHHTLENGAGSPYVAWFYFDPRRLYGKKHFGAYPNRWEQFLLQMRRDSCAAIGYKGWWELPALPKFNTQTPAVREFIFDVAEQWIKFGIDGWRLDVPAEIDDDAFWQEFRRRVKAINPEAYIVGEIWEESQRWLQGDQFDAVMNYLVTIASLGFFTGKHLDQKETNRAGGYRNKVRPLNVTEFAERIEHILALYDPAITQVQLNLLDSHDTPRFITSASGDLASLKLAMLFMFTYPGAPCIYYGDEIGMEGRHDPDCRRSFPWNESKWDHALLNYVKQCIALRKAHPALRRGSYQPLYAADGVYAFGRKLDAERLVIALNAAEETRTIDIAVESLDLADGPLTAIFGRTQASVQDGKINSLRLSPRSAVVLERK